MSKHGPNGEKITWSKCISMLNLMWLCQEYRIPKIEWNLNFIFTSLFHLYISLYLLWSLRLEYSFLYFGVTFSVMEFWMPRIWLVCPLHLNYLNKQTELLFCIYAVQYPPIVIIQIRFGFFDLANATQALDEKFTHPLRNNQS